MGHTKKIFIKNFNPAPVDLCESPVAGLEFVLPPFDVVEVVEVGLEPATAGSSVPGSSVITSG
jgi:hypothetical protein